MLTHPKDKAAPIDEIGDSQMSMWFNNLVSKIRVDELSIETNTASTEVSDFYSLAMNGNIEDLLLFNREGANKYFIAHMLYEFVSLLKESPVELAFSFSGNNVLAWAKTKDNDEATENMLYMSEAEVNAKYSDKGYSIVATVVEESDNLSTPPHYSPIIK